MLKARHYSNFTAGLFLPRYHRLSALCLGAALMVLAWFAFWCRTPSSQASTASCATPTFAAASFFATGIEHAGLALSDLNGDGKRDAVITNTQAGSISVLPGVGNGSFGSATNYTVGLEPNAVVIADLNNDSKLDVAVSNLNSDNVSLLLGDGAGGLGTAITFLVGSRPTAIIAADFNGDGNVDLATPNSGTISNVSILLGNGNGGFAPLQNYSCGNNVSPINRPEPRAIAAGDFNGDGAPDLVVANANQNFNNLAVLLNTGAGSFAAPAFLGIGAATSPRAVILADFNSDGKLDFASGNFSDNVSVILGNGSGGALSTTNFATGAIPYALTTGDINGDARTDLIVSNQQSSNVSMLLGDGGGGFGSSNNFSTSAGPKSLALADLNSDGTQDVAVSTSTDVSVLLNLCPANPQGVVNFSAATNFATGINPHAATTKDINGDGKLDLAVANTGSNNVTYFVGSGAGGFSSPANLATGTSPVAIVGLDFDESGTQDLAVANRDSNNVSLLRNNGSGGFFPATSITAGSQPYAIVTADFNGDSRFDLATANHGSADVSILLNSGAGNFTASTPIAAGTNPRSLVVADFNADGKIDLAVANEAANNVSLLLGNGVGGFSSAGNFAVGSAPLGIASSDLNNDTKPDLVTANSGSNNVSVLLGDGTGGFADAANFNAGSSPYAVVIADFYGDGKVDLAISNSAANDVVVLKGNGNGGFAAPVSFATGTSPRILCAADLNSDDKPDLAVPNFSSNNVSILINTSVITAQVSGTVFDTSGNRIANVNITAINSSAQTVAATNSDSNGNYSMQLPLDLYTLKATPPVGSGLAVAQIDNVAVTNDIVQDITLTRGALLSGRVTDRDGQPYVNAEVILQGPGDFSVRTNTAADGSYSLRVVPNTYTLQVGYSGPFAGMDSTYTGQFFGRGPITLTTDTVRDFAIQERYLTGIVKTQSGTPVSNTLIRGNLGFSQPPSNFAGLEWTVFANVRTGSTGNYRLLLFPGNAGLTVFPPAGAGLGQASLEINLPSDTVRDIILDPAIQFHGHVTDRDGQPFPGVQISLEAMGGFQVNVQTNSAADGSYTLEVTPGNYRLTVGSSNQTTFPGLFFGGTDNITLTSDVVRDFVIQNRKFTGTVRDNNNQPVPNTLVRACYGSDFSGVGWNGCSAVTTDNNGFYDGNFLPGTNIDLTVNPPTGLGLAPRLIFFDLVNDQVMNITLNGGARYSGTATNHNGQPLANLQLSLQSIQSNDFQLQTTTATDGTFSLPVDPGTYSLSIASLGNNFYNGTGQVSILQDTTRNFVIQDRTITGTIRDPVGNVVSNVMLQAFYTASFDGLSWATASHATSAGNGSYTGSFLIGSFDLNVTPPPSSGLSARTVHVDLQDDMVLDITLQSPTHSITGRVADANGNAIVGVNMALTGSQSAISTTDGNGNYVFQNLSEGGSYTVTPSRTSYSFVPPSTSFANLTSNQTANFTGTLVTFNVSGTVQDGSNAGISGVTVTLSGATTSVTQTNASGQYLFSSVAAFTDYSVKPNKQGFIFTPPRVDIVNLDSNRVVDFNAAPQPSPTPTPSQDEDFSNVQRDPEKFNLGSLSTDPTAFDRLVQVRQANGQLEVTPRASAFGTHFNGYTTVNAVDIGSRSPSVEVVQAASGAQTIFSVGSDFNNTFGFVVQPAGAPVAGEVKRASPLDVTQLIFQIRVNGQLSALSIPYDPVAHRYWRFRYEQMSNSILFETSPNSLAWTIRHSVVLQRSVTPMAAELSSGTSSSTTNPGTAIFDNFHLGEKFSISGQVKDGQDAAVSGVLMSLAGSSSATTTTSSSGAYSFNQLDAGGTFTITPSLSNTTFSPPSRTFNSLSMNQNADFIATPTSGIPTPVGSNVTVQSGDVSVSFAQVNTAGLTAISSLDLAGVGPLPEGFAITSNSVAFDVSTTAAYTPPVGLCFVLPTGIDSEAFDSMAVLHKENGIWLERTASRAFNTRSVCGSVDSLSPFVVASKMTVMFSGPTFSVNEGNGSTLINVTRLGDKTNAASIDFQSSDGTAIQRADYILAAGRLQFAAGESSKTIRVLIVDDAYVESNETLAVSLSNPKGLLIAAPSSALLAIVDNDSIPPIANPADEAQFFVRQHYYDFLSRLPDQGGLDFWTGQITQCGNDASCQRIQRITVSNAFYYEQEYQQTGAYVVRLYRTAYGNNQPLSNPNSNPQFPGEDKKLVSYAAFSPDRARVRGGSQLAQTQVDLANAFVERSQFLSRYPATLDGPGLVDAILATVNTDLGVDLSSQRNALISLFNQGGRGAVLYRLADDNLTNPVNNRSLIDAEYNRAFVLTQYFGYLRRNPDVAGFVFWLGQVNSAPLRALEKQRAMVCAFITSLEYQQRFSSVATHNNTECQ